jgi:hypothetical protein
MHQSLQHWITLTFGSRRGLDEKMGWSLHTTDRWYKKNPKRFLMYTKELAPYIDVEELQWMIDQRLYEIEYEHRAVVENSERG